MTESVAMCQHLVEKFGPSDLQVKPNEADYPNYLNWLFMPMRHLLFHKL